MAPPAPNRISTCPTGNCFVATLMNASSTANAAIDAIIQTIPVRFARWRGGCVCMCGIIDEAFCDCEALNASDKWPRFETSVQRYRGLSLVGSASRCPAGHHFTAAHERWSSPVPAPGRHPARAASLPAGSAGSARSAPSRWHTAAASPAGPSWLQPALVPVLAV